MNRIFDALVLSKFALDVLIAQDAFLWAKLVSMSSEQTAIKRYWWQKSEGGGFERVGRAHGRHWVS